MNRNGYRAFPQAPPRLTCSGCGKPIDIENEDTFVETIAGQWSQDGERIVWHQDCFNTFLDEGEET